MRADVLVEAAQDVLAAIDQNGLDAEALEDAGEFDGDVTAAGDDDAGGKFLEMEGFVGGGRQLMARQMAAFSGEETTQMGVAPPASAICVA